MSDAIRRLRKVAEKAKTAVCWQVWTNDVAELVKEYDKAIAWIDVLDKENKLLRSKLVEVGKLR